jgi:hypothetical protein
MDNIRLTNAKIYDKNGNVTDADAEKTVSFKVTPRGGIAYYVSAECEEGFSDSKGISLDLGIFDTSEYLAIENHSPFWCRPFFGDSLKKLPAKVQELLIKDGDVWKALLPVCDDTFKSLICGGESGAELFVFAGGHHHYRVGSHDCERKFVFTFAGGENNFGGVCPVYNVEINAKDGHFAHYFTSEKLNTINYITLFLTNQ